MSIAAAKAAARPRPLQQDVSIGLTDRATDVVEDHPPAASGDDPRRLQQARDVSGQGNTKDGHERGQSILDSRKRDWKTSRVGEGVGARGVCSRLGSPQ